MRSDCRFVFQIGIDCDIVKGTESLAVQLPAKSKIELSVLGTDCLVAILVELIIVIEQLRVFPEAEYEGRLRGFAAVCQLFGVFVQTFFYSSSSSNQCEISFCLRSAGGFVTMGASFPWNRETASCS